MIMTKITIRPDPQIANPIGLNEVIWQIQFFFAESGEAELINCSAQMTIVNSESTETSSQSRVVPRRVSRLCHKACDKLLYSKQGNLNTHSHNCNTSQETGQQGMALLMAPVRIREFTNARQKTAEQFQRSKTAEQVPSIVPTRSQHQHQHQATKRRRYPETLITPLERPRTECSCNDRRRRDDGANDSIKASQNQNHDDGDIVQIMGGL